MQRDDARGELYFFLVTSMAGLMVMASAVEALALYLALDIALPKGEAVNPQNGVEWSLMGVDDAMRDVKDIRSCTFYGNSDWAKRIDRLAAYIKQEEPLRTECAHFLECID